MKDGPRAGFRTVDAKAEDGLLGVDTLVPFKTKNVIENVLAYSRSCRMNDTIVACPWEVTAFSNGLNIGVTESITTVRRTG